MIAACVGCDFVHCVGRLKPIKVKGTYSNGSIQIKSAGWLALLINSQRL